MTKDDARKEVLRLWRALPVMERQTFGQAQAFATDINPAIDFLTMGDKLKVITAWLNRDLLDIAAAVEAVRLRAKGTAR